MKIRNFADLVAEVERDFAPDRTVEDWEREARENPDYFLARTAGRIAARMRKTESEFETFEAEDGNLSIRRRRRQ